MSPSTTSSSASARSSDPGRSTAPRPSTADRWPRRLRACGALALGLLAGCGRGQSPQDEAAAAQHTYALRCASCHGREGRGDGAEGAQFDPKPRNLTDRGWQAATADAQISRVIVSGGPLVGQRQAMPGAPDLMNRPAEVAALVRYIRGLR